MRRAPLKRKTPMKRRNQKRKLKRFKSNYGSLERVLWMKRQPCACEGKHPACSGPTQVSHTVSKAHHGDASACIPQSQGCHAYIGQHGWRAWEMHVGNLLGLRHAFVVEDGAMHKRRFDRRACARHWATLGPDAPRVSS